MEKPSRELLYSLFRTEALIEGRRVEIGSDDSIKLKEKFIYRGFTTKKGRPRRDLNWMEQIVVIMRDATTGEPINHEWWGAETQKSDWLCRLEVYYLNAWLYIWTKGEQLDPRRLGQRVAVFMAENQRKSEFALSDSDYFEDWQASELDKARRGMAADMAKKTCVKFAGFRSLKELAEDLNKWARNLASVVMEIVGRQSVEESTQFMEGWMAGHARTPESGEREEDSTSEAVEVLWHYWDRIDKMKTRTEIAEFIRSKLPHTRQKHFEDERHWDAFRTGRLKDIFDRIKLSPASRGRPKKGGPRELLDPVERIEALTEILGDFAEKHPPLIVFVPELRWVREFNTERFKASPA